MKTFMVVFEVDGWTSWATIEAENAEDAAKRMTEKLVSEDGYAESDIIVWEVGERASA